MQRPFVNHETISINVLKIIANEWTYLKASVVALVANVCDNVRSDIRIANDANSIMFLAQSSQSNTRLLSAEYKIGMMLRHYSDE